MTKIETLTMPYKVTGEGEPLVLIPGGLTGQQSWDPFVPDFSTSQKVIQLQLLNVQYGLENKDLPAGYSVRMESNALAESLREVGVTAPADFIGWSLGGMVLLDFALGHPHLVQSLTLIEPPAFWLLKTHNQVNSEIQKIMDFMERLRGNITEQQLEQFMTAVGMVSPGSSLREHPNWTKWVSFRHSLRNCRHVVRHDDDPNRLKDFKPPVLLVKGTGSATYLHEIIDLLLQDLPNAQAVELPGGHAAHITSKDDFVRVIRTFHARIEKA